MRIRIIYSKRGGACFVPHVVLSAIFSRAALRAGLKLSMTQGFSPRAKISFGPELPAGVVALNEPADIFFEFQNAPENLLEIYNSGMPEGFNLNRIIFPEDDSPSLGKVCKSASYLLRSKVISPEDLKILVSDFYGISVIKAECDNNEGWLNLILRSPAQNGIGGFVKKIISEERIKGWHEINIVREAIGIWDGKRVFI